MPILLQNAILADIDPLGVEPGDLRISGGNIAERGRNLPAHADDEVIDCRGAVVLPGLVNGHTHLYSALAVGMPPPPKTPANFLEVLRYVWWRLDQALDAESIEMSARMGALAALQCGTTTLIDHHASPRCIANSLDMVENGIAEIGLRGVLCYETTDRHGVEGRLAGIEENRRYLARCRQRDDRRFAGLVGAHASFTLEDESLDLLADLADEYSTGVHIHVAEDPCDEADSLGIRGSGLIDRLADRRILRPDSIFAHGTHLSEAAIARVNQAGVTLAHNPRSNMNNAVGYAPVAEFTGPVMLGTDGIGGDMLAEAKAAWYISRHAGGGRTPADIVAMLAASARRASQALGITLGQLQADAAADIVISDYLPHTLLDTDNLPGHLIFGMSANHVVGVMVDGRFVLRDREAIMLDAHYMQTESRRVAAELWRRMAELPTK